MVLEQQVKYHRYRKYFSGLSQIYQQKKTRTYAEIIFSLLTISLFLFLAIKPTLMTITHLVKQIKDQKEVVKKLQAKINALQEAQNEYTLVENNLYLVDQALPENPRVSTLVKEIEVLTRHASVDLKTIRFGQAPLLGKAPSVNREKDKKASTNQIPSISFTLATTGDYRSLKNFLQSLSSLRRVVLVDSFIFKAAEGKESNSPLTLSLNGRACYLEPDQK